MIQIEPHPLLDPRILAVTFPAPLGQTPSPPWLVELLTLDAQAPFTPDEETRQAVRSLLRHGGYRPTGRGKPASEYLVRAAGEGSLGSINAAVDVCNAVSLHSGLPISVIDLDLAVPPFRIQVAEPGAEYTFNASGQVMRLDGLLCIQDAQGPCANGVKDSQRTKTTAKTRRVLYVIWGTNSREGRTAAALTWASELLTWLGASAT